MDKCLSYFFAFWRIIVFDCYLKFTAMRLIDQEVLFEARRTGEGKVKAYSSVSRAALEEQRCIGQNIKVD